MCLQVCETVTETKCDIVGYTECTTTEVEKTYKSQESGYDYFQTKECKPFTVEVDHWKEKYKCENVTKQNCVTKWKMLENGTKVFFDFLTICMFYFDFKILSTIQSFKDINTAHFTECIINLNVFYRSGQVMMVAKRKLGKNVNHIVTQLNLKKIW